ncbi:hypothetical protein IMZ29_08585 [Achromobacter sp. GG226]|uniref:hypothetical protein n=1 Tax=Verticiella alkaliphila TaxID=2779529 RepID=UPI001C0E2648|nr:hypothetical protein [Verticiella sp. GG226]MBU4610593.1 hypothetical protein [Verticiella sp. GG226]
MTARITAALLNLCGAGPVMCYPTVPSLVASTFDATSAWHDSAFFQQAQGTHSMNSIVYIVGLVVIVVAILSFIGLA